MSKAAAREHCRQLVACHDYHFYIASGFLPAKQRPVSWALRALNYELSSVRQRVRQENVAATRFLFWRAAVEAAAHWRAHGNTLHTSHRPQAQASKAERMPFSLSLARGCATPKHDEGAFGNAPQDSISDAALPLPHKREGRDTSLWNSKSPCGHNLDNKICSALEKNSVLSKASLMHEKPSRWSCQTHPKIISETHAGGGLPFEDDVNLGRISKLLRGEPIGLILRTWLIYLRSKEDLLNSSAVLSKSNCDPHVFADHGDPSEASLVISRLRSVVLANEANFKVSQYQTVAELESYLEKSESTLFLLQLELAGVRGSPIAERVASHLGKAVGIAAAIRNMPFLLPLRVCPVPLDICLRHGFSARELFLNNNGSKIENRTSSVLGENEKSAPKNANSNTGMRLNFADTSASTERSLRDAVRSLANVGRDHLQQAFSLGNREDEMPSEAIAAMLPEPSCFFSLFLRK